MIATKKKLVIAKVKIKVEYVNLKIEIKFLFIN
jgi:hypothetical protein